MIESHWDVAMRLEKKLKIELGKSSFWSDPMRKLRMELQQAYEQALLNHSSYDMAVAKDACELAWKSCFYKPIEEFRARIKIASQSVSQAKESKSASLAEIEGQQHKLHLAFVKFLDESCASYRLFIWKLDKVYGSNSERGNIFELSSREMEKATASLTGLSHSPSTPASLPCLLHRCLVYLGDLYRYKANAQSSLLSDQGSSKPDSWQRAIRSYQCAASLFPSSGNPYNQLAVMSYQAGDELRAVYFYFRSLKVSQPFSTARQNLLLLFEKNRSRFSQAHPSIKARAEAKAATLSDVTLSFVRLNGLFFDKINAQDYPQVKQLAFLSLEALITSPVFLSSLAQSISFDHPPLHLATLATFSANSIAPQTVIVFIELITSLLNASSTQAARHKKDECRVICARLSAGALICIQLIGCNPQGILQPLLDQIDASSSGRSDSEAFDLILKLLDAGVRYARSHPSLYCSLAHADGSTESLTLPENKELIGFEPLRMVWERKQSSISSSGSDVAMDRLRVKQLLQLFKWLGENIQTSLASVNDTTHRTVRVRVSCQQLVSECDSGLSELDLSPSADVALETDHHAAPVPPAPVPPAPVPPAPVPPAPVPPAPVPPAPVPPPFPLIDEVMEEEEEVVVWRPRGAVHEPLRPPASSPPPLPLIPPPPPLPTLLLGNMQPQHSPLMQQHIEAVSERHLEATALRMTNDIFGSDLDDNGGGRGMRNQVQKEREDFSFLGMFAVPHNN